MSQSGPGRPRNPLPEPDNALERDLFRWKQEVRDAYEESDESTDGIAKANLGIPSNTTLKRVMDGNYPWQELGAVKILLRAIFEADAASVMIARWGELHKWRNDPTGYAVGLRSGQASPIGSEKDTEQNGATALTASQGPLPSLDDTPDATFPVGSELFGNELHETATPATFGGGAPDLSAAPAAPAEGDGQPVAGETPATDLAASGAPVGSAVPMTASPNSSWRPYEDPVQELPEAAAPEKVAVTEGSEPDKEHATHEGGIQGPGTQLEFDGTPSRQEAEMHVADALAIHLPGTTTDAGSPAQSEPDTNRDEGNAAKSNVVEPHSDRRQHRFAVASGIACLAFMAVTGVGFGVLKVVGHSNPTEKSLNQAPSAGAGHDLTPAELHPSGSSSGRVTAGEGTRNGGSPIATAAPSSGSSSPGSRSATSGPGPTPSTGTAPITHAPNPGPTITQTRSDSNSAPPVAGVVSGVVLQDHERAGTGSVRVVSLQLAGSANWYLITVVSSDDSRVIGSACTQDIPATVGHIAADPGTAVSVSVAPYMTKCNNNPGYPGHAKGFVG